MYTLASILRSLGRWCRRALTVWLLAAASLALGQPVPLAGAIGSAGAFAPLLIPLVFSLILVAADRSDQFKDVALPTGQHDWSRVDTIATKHLHRLAEKRQQQRADEASAGDLRETEQRWLLIRAYARQRMTRYDEALADYRAATDIVESPDLSILLNRGICEMVLGRWGEAEHLMMRLAERAPQRWEPQYNLGVIRSITGDAIGARLALERLRPLNAAMADALDEQYVSRLPTSGDAAPQRSDAPSKGSEALGSELTRALAELPVLPSGDLGAISAPGRLAHPRLAIDGRAIVLPPGEWVLASRREYRIRGAIAGRIAQSAEEQTFPALAGSSFLIRNGELRAIVTFASHRGTQTSPPIFFGPEPCDAQGAFVIGRLGYETRGEAAGTCAYVRRLDTPGESTSEDVRRAATLARRLGAGSPLGWYEFHYTGYRERDYGDTYPTFWSVQVLWPATALAGDLVAVDWLTGFPYAANPSRQRTGGGIGIFGKPRYEDASIGWVGR